MAVSASSQTTIEWENIEVVTDIDILSHLKEWDSVVIGNSSLSESYVPSSQSRCPDS